MRLEGLCVRKIPVTPLRIEPATYQLVANCLNQLRHSVPVLGISHGGKGGQSARLVLPPSCADCLEILGALGLVQAPNGTAFTI